MRRPAHTLGVMAAVTAALVASVLPLLAISSSAGASVPGYHSRSGSASIVSSRTKGVAAGGTLWSAASAIDPTGGGLTSVSCPSASYCVAVDVDGSALVYNGSTWTLPAQIIKGNTTAAYVSCTSASFCAVVSGAEAVIHSGSGWGTPQGVDPGETLDGVSCVGGAAGFCVAVDTAGDVLTWEPSGWGAPVSVDENGFGFTSVSCLSDLFCVAGDGDGLAYTYNGTSWSNVTIDSGFPLAVSCTSVTFCVAAAKFGNGLIYNGTTWTAPASIDPDSGDSAVSCTSPSFCAVVGDGGDASIYNGSEWSAPPVAVDEPNWLTSVSCSPGALFCVAVDQVNGTGSAFTYTPYPTTTVISSTTPAPVVGQPIVVGVTVTGPSSGPGAATPTGNVTVVDGARQCTGSLSGSNGVAIASCSIVEANTGSFPFTARYDGDGTFNLSSTTKSTTVSVGQATTKTKLAVSQPSVVYGDEQAVRLSVVVAPEFTLAPAGKVTISSGTTSLCVVTLSAGAGGCALSATRFGVGGEAFTAAYTATPDFAASVSGTARLSITVASSKTVLKESKTSVVFGDEQLESLAVTVTPRYAGVPTGSVTVTAGTAVVCSIALAAAKGSCLLSASEIAAGTASLVASYAATANFSASVSAPVKLVVNKETSKTALTLSKTVVNYGDEQVEDLSVTVSPQYPGTAIGTVTIRTGTKVVCSISLSGGKGSCHLTPKELAAGSHALVATYNGNADVSGSLSASRSLGVSG